MDNAAGMVLVFKIYFMKFYMNPINLALSFIAANAQKKICPVMWIPVSKIQNISLVWVMHSCASYQELFLQWDFIKRVLLKQIFKAFVVTQRYVTQILLQERTRCPAERTVVS